MDVSFERIATTKPIDFTQPGAKVVNVQTVRQPSPRVMEEFSKMLASYKKESIHNKHEDLWMTLETLDKVT